METAEHAGVTVEHLKAKMSLIEYQLDRLDDIALSVEDRELEEDLRNVATNIRRSIDGMRDELQPAEEYDFAA